MCIDSNQDNGISQTMDLWRISNYPSLDGEGGRLSPGRWNSGGVPVVYTAASPPGALLETLVHLEVNDFSVPPTYTLLHITAPNRIKIPFLKVPDSDEWKVRGSLTRKLGDRWLASRSSAIARVPCSILPATFNYLVNPLHPDASRIKIKKIYKAFFDVTLLRTVPSSLAQPIQ